MKYAGKDIVLYDGPKGSMFFAKGYKGCADIYNIEAYEDTKDIIRKYANAGSEWIQTNTFNSNGFALGSRGYGDRQRDIISNSIRSANEVADEMLAKNGRRPEVIFITGPTGRMVEPYGDTTEQEAYDSFYEEFKIASECGIYNAHIETFMDLNEMTVAIRAASAIREELAKKGIHYKIICTMAFESHGRTMFGNSPEDCYEVFKEYGVDAFGANCGCTAKDMLKVIEGYSAAAGPDAMIIAKPNAGKPITQGDKVTYAETPEMFAHDCLALLDAGAKIIGGCCGTSDLHIAALKDLLENS